MISNRLRTFATAPITMMGLALLAVVDTVVTPTFAQVTPPPPPVLVPGPGQVPGQVPGRPVKPSPPGAKHCAAEVSLNILFSEFVQNLIGNNAQRWAGDLAANGYPPRRTLPPTTSQQVSAAIQRVAATHYDFVNAVAEAYKKLLSQSTNIHADCFGGQSKPDNEVLKQLIEEENASDLASQILNQVASYVADSARNGLAPDNSKHIGNTTIR